MVPLIVPNGDVPKKALRIRKIGRLKTLNNSVRNSIATRQ